MGFLSGIFGGGKTPKLKLPSLDARGQEFQEELYGMIERGLAGQGLTPELTGGAIGQSLTATTNAYQEGRGELGSYLNRFVPQGDTKVRSQAYSDLQRNYANQMQGIRESADTLNFADRQAAQEAAFESLGSEKRMATDLLDMYNQSAYDQYNSPTFGSELAGGLGSALGLYLGRQKTNPMQQSYVAGRDYGMTGFARMFKNATSFFTQS